METQQLLSPSSSGRRCSFSASPEFEFWMVRNPSFPQPDLLSADQLFLDGVLRPLHLLHLHPPPQSQPDPDPQHDPPTSIPQPGPQISSPSPFTSSKRWIDIFKKTDKKPVHEDKDKEKKREKKSRTGTSSAELNINIWPFSRSKSAGNNATRPRMFPGPPGTRKVSSAPCSRSNSAGESKSRKWPSSPGRPGVHLGRSSPVWQVRRSGCNGSGISEPCGTRGNEKILSKKEVTESRRSKTTTTVGGSRNTKSKVVNLNVPMCMGYRQNLSCRSGGGRSSGNTTVSGGNVFSIRSLFTKKVY